MSHDIFFYPLNQSPFFKLRSKKKLADLLFHSVSGLESLGTGDHRYSAWDEKKKNGGTRRIEAPFDELKITQKRIANLLQKITPPDFLMAPVKRRSYVDNAARHLGSRAFRLLDIENFFPSCTDKRVYWFFNKVMFCSPDVASILTKLVTFQGRLPQGSPCSPILAYFSYSDMWAEIEALCKAEGYKLSIYADDITISGDVIYEKHIWKTKQILHKFGHNYCRKKEKSVIDGTADITGVIVNGDELLLPNRQHRAWNDLKMLRQTTKSAAQIEKIERQLRGRQAQANQILKHSNSVP